MIPKTRGDCIDGPRPCPYETCKYHLGRDTEPTCTLDVADQGGVSNRTIAKILEVSPQHVDKIVEGALAKFPNKLRLALFNK